MGAATLVGSATIQLVAGMAFLVVARALSLRHAGDTERLAARAFVVWWGALGVYMVISSALSLVAAAGYAPLGLFLAARIVNIPLLMLSVWGITFHVAYLFTGRASLNIIIAAFYAVCAAAFFALLVVEAPTGVHVSDWGAELERAGGTPLLNVLYVFIGLPPILASLAYGTLYWRVDAPIKKYRIALVAGSILAWVGSGLVARVSAGDFLKFVTLAIFGLGAAAAVLLAYFPPPGLRARLDPDDLDAHSPRRQEARRRREERRAALAKRCRTLV